MTLQRSLGALTVIGLSVSNSFGQTCASDLDLLTAPNEMVTVANPCTEIGAAYILGLGGKLTEYKGSLHSPDYPYYLIIQYYLAERREQDNSLADEAGYLISAAQVLALEPVESRNQRWFSYQAFIVGEYWDSHIKELDGSRRVVSETFEILLSESGFSRFAELACFVENDLPSLSSEDVVESAKYGRCVLERQ